MELERAPRPRGGPAFGLAKWLGLLAFLAVFARAEPARAYTWMLQHGYTACSTCHADPSGGELLTPYGRVTADLLLRMHYGPPKAEQEAPSPGVLWGAFEPPEEVLVSGSYRNLYILQSGMNGVPEKPFTFVPVMQADLYGQLKLGNVRLGGSIGISKVAAGSYENARAAQVTTGQEDQLNMIARNYYVGYQFGQTGTLRGGRLNLPFGLRIPEHTSWVRTSTRTDRESDQQHGLAFAYVSERMRAEVMGIAGNYQTGPDEVRERGYSLFVEGIASSKLAAGISSKVTYSDWDRITYERNSLRQAHGFTLRAAPFENFTILGEVDALFRSHADAGYVGFAQLNFEFIQGLHALLTGEVMDQGAYDNAVLSPGFGQPRFGGWFSVDWFFFKQMEFRTDVILRTNEPFTVLGQLHFYL